MIRRFIAAAAFAVPLFGWAPAYADATPPPPEECSSPSVTCQYDGTEWNVYDNNAPEVNDPTGDPTSSVKTFAITGFATVFGLGVIGAIWRVRVARRIAAGAGLNPDAAAAAALFGTGGLTATYLAANLQPRPDPSTEPAVRHVEPPAHDSENRLSELKRLHDEGLITDAEYTRRRTAIVDSL